MTGLIKTSLKELLKKKFFFFMMLLVCIIAMQTTLSALTNATQTIYQRYVFEKSIGFDASKVLHLNYQQTYETDEFAFTLQNFHSYIGSLNGVKAIGQFDETSIYFTELMELSDYISANKPLIQNGKYKNHPEISRILRADEEILSLVKGGITAYHKPRSGNVPICTSEAFKNFLPIGTILTDDYTGDTYEIAGYFSKDTEWVDENDLIRFPLISLEGWFIAPFTQNNRNDIMTQLSCLHNTYILLDEDADISTIINQISEFSKRNGFKATASSLEEEYRQYQSETQKMTNGQMFLAIFIMAMALSVVISVFTTNAMLKKKQYGIMLANGFTLKEIAVSACIEIAIVVFLSTIISWGLKWFELNYSSALHADLFRDQLINAHLQFSLPLCIFIAVILTFAASIIPMIKIKNYQPCELIGGDTNGIN